MKKSNNIEKQVKKELCFQCGTCESICPTNAIKMELSKNKGLIYPVIKSDICIDCGKCIKVCPVNHVDTNIDNHLLKEDELIEVYSAVDEDIFNKSTSGGLVTSILTYLFDKNLITKAIVVGMNENNPIEAKPYIITNKDDLKPSSVYQPVALNQLLKQISSTDKVAYVGLPCHVRGLNQYLKLNKELKDSFIIKIGLICTIGRGLNGTKLALKKYDIKEDNVDNLRYRVGTHPSSMLVNNTKKIYMGDYLKYIDFLFYPKGCSYCNDLFNDECDISVGDPWGKIDRKVAMAIIKNKDMKKILDDMIKFDYIKKEGSLSNVETIETQNKGVKYKIKSYNERIALYRKLGTKDNINLNTSKYKIKLNSKNIGLSFLKFNSIFFNSRLGYTLSKYIPSKILVFYRHKIYGLCTKD